jgi:hypothetical protein
MRWLQEGGVRSEDTSLRNSWEYEAWKAEISKKMQAGKEIYYLGNPDRFPKT